jgi:hypothetical protein
METVKYSHPLKQHHTSKARIAKKNRSSRPMEHYHSLVELKHRKIMDPGTPNLVRAGRVLCINANPRAHDKASRIFSFHQL